MCHEMSCFVMNRLHRPRRSPAVRILHVVPLSRSVRATAEVRAVRPFSARIACAPAPAFASARFARLIARASRARGALLLSVPPGFFRTGARRETKRPADAASSRPILPQFYRGQALTRNYFKIRNKIPPAEGNASALLESAHRQGLLLQAMALCALRSAVAAMPASRPSANGRNGGVRCSLPPIARSGS